jgi:NAD(P)-dependent dehydrogenase (short-subunit alcohol dehydrogenase family)
VAGAPVGAEALEGQRLLVVGASSGIGRELGLAAVRAGAHVALAARRYDRLREVELEADAVASEAGMAISVQCDVRRPIACELAVTAAVQQLGGIDTVVFATGINRLAWLAETSAEAWRDLVDTNLIGAALITQAAVPHLRVTGGRVGYLSSHSVARPWPGLGAYAATKSALDTMVAAWRVEEPHVAFTRIVVGPTVTGMADAWDPATASTMFELWSRAGYMEHEPTSPSAVAARIIAWAAAPAPPDDVWLVEDAER